MFKPQSSVMGKRALLTWCFLFSLVIVSTVRGQQVEMLDLAQGPIDNLRVSRSFEETANRLMRETDQGKAATVKRLFEEAPAACHLDLASPSVPPATDRQDLYQHMVQSTVILGELFNCGRCDKTHARFSGGVVVSRDGLVLTNSHILEAIDLSKSEAYFAMTWDGKVWPITEVVFANRVSDVALLRLDGQGHDFHAAALAETPARPMDPVRVISHPSSEFFVMTHGEVSRYVATGQPSAANQGSAEVWMEITAAFGGGSSGCGVFNERGEIIGLVSRIHPLMRTAPAPSSGNGMPHASFVEMILRRCVPLAAIRAGLSQENAASR